MHMQRKDDTPAKPDRALLVMPAKSVKIWRDCNIRNVHGCASFQNTAVCDCASNFDCCAAVARRVWLVEVAPCPTARRAGGVMHSVGGWHGNAQQNTYTFCTMHWHYVNMPSALQLVNGGGIMMICIG